MVHAKSLQTLGLLAVLSLYVPGGTSVPIAVSHAFQKHASLTFTFAFPKLQMIDVVVIHFGGFTLDLLGGWLLLYSKTRPVAIVLLTKFHIMNATMFEIGACMQSYFLETCICQRLMNGLSFYTIFASYRNVPLRHAGDEHHLL